MNRLTTTFYLRRSSVTNAVFTEAIVLLLLSCIRHAVATGTKNDECPNLGPKGPDLIKALRETFKLESQDAVDNARILVNDFELRHFAPAISEADKGIAKRVLRTLYANGPLSSMVCDDIIQMIDDFGN